MSELQLASFLVTKSADVTVAARKARMLAAFADIENGRRIRLGKALTETCRSILSFGGTASIEFGLITPNGQTTVEISIQWLKPDGREQGSKDARATAARKADSLLVAVADARSAAKHSRESTAPEMAIRRVGELLDGFTLQDWPGPGTAASLRMLASPGFKFVDADTADWSALLGETQIEEALRRLERRRKILASELRMSRLQEELLEEASCDSGDIGLVSMLSLVASQTDNGVAILDKNACVAWVNNAFAAQWGYELSACAGQSFETLIRHDDSDESAIGRIHSALQTGSSDYVELLAMQADNSGRWTGVSLTPSLDEADTVHRWIVLLRDITQQKSAHDMLAAARDAAEQSSRSKSEFLANMSHEIRTPMNAVIGMTELALSTELTPEQHEYLTTVRMSAEALLELLNDILDLSKIEAGKVELDEVNFDLSEVVRDSLKALAVKAHSKGLELATRMPPDLPQFLHGDPLRLRQILINLVGNAIKFTEHGEVVVEFDQILPGERDEPIHLKFDVRDTGIGIPPDRLGSIFESFTQVDTSTTRQFGGTGLGLTITAELLRLMGGYVHVQSEFGVGSSFHVTVPFGLADEPLMPFTERVSFSRKHLEGRTVLVVDDNATNRRILEELLTSWGLRPRLAENADAAMKELESAAFFDRPFDLLLVDAVMPGRDGFTMIKEIQHRDDFRFGTVMMLSSSDRADSSRRCRELGIRTYLVKPVSQSSLLESILGALAGETFPGSVDSLPQDPTSAESFGKTARKTAGPNEELASISLRVLIADDHEANRQLAGKILEKRGHQWCQAVNGSEVLQRLQKESFDLILMDVQMPELDGFQTTAAIRQLEVETGTHIPVVALTAHAMKGDREKCLEAGMDAYLSKPLRARDLILLVEKLCEPVTAARFETISNTAVQTGDSDQTISDHYVASVPDNGETSTAVDFKGALDRMDGDVELLVDQMQFFLDDAPLLVNRLVEAISMNNGPQLQSAAHRLKGLVSSYDQATAADLCLKLELAGLSLNLKGTGRLLTPLQAHVERLVAAIRGFVADHQSSLDQSRNQFPMR
ncbi:MAG: response regulator [Rhodopirellula sp.]|nr:response regulator [Rhodopirellula sp.]